MTNVSPVNTTLPSKSRVIGTSGKDTLFGTPLDDILKGFRGDDQLFSGFGNDLLYGGPGNDWLQDSGERQGGNDTIYGGSGNDTVFSGAGNDRIFGGDGDDFLRDWPYGGSGNDVINGDEGDDFVIGDDGDDLLRGGTGNDSVFGGRGNDTLTGGPGDDTFIFRDEVAWQFSALGIDRITDFRAREDRIELNQSTFNQLNYSSSSGWLQPLRVNDFSIVAENSAVGQESALIVYSLGSRSVFYNENRGLSGLGEGGAFATLSSTAKGIRADNFVVDTFFGL